jgi:dipeptidase D
MVRTEQDAITIATSSRSFVEKELHRLQEAIRERGEADGATAEVQSGYGPWEPDPNSQLAKVAERVYAEVFGQPAEVQVIHAGLECGVIVSRMPGMEAISFGPLIRGAHTPEEHVYVSTVDSTWQLLTALLRAL